MQQKSTIELTEYIDAAHHLPDSESLSTKKCLNLHGHTYGVRVNIEASTFIDGFVVDFGTLKSIINELDHATIVWDKDQKLIDYLNDTHSKFVIVPNPPTAENIAHFIYDNFVDRLPSNCKKVTVAVQEGTKPGKGGWVTYETIAQ